MQQLRKHLRNILKTTLPFDWKTALVALLAIQGSGCGTISYYRQAAAGQWQIERSKRSIRDLKQSKEINAALKEQPDVMNLPLCPPGAAVPSTAVNVSASMRRAKVDTKAMEEQLRPMAHKGGKCAPESDTLESQM